MPELIIKIKDKIAKPLNNCVICSNSDYTVKFIFDEEWEKEPLRIARFIWNKQYVDVQFTGDTCEVPVISKTNSLAIGVYAGDLRTTTPAILTCYTSILCEDVIEHSVTPSEYEEIMKLLNAQATDIAALKAVDKRLWTNLDTINKTASAAKIKAEEGVAKADDALTATRTNTTNINSLTTDVNALKAVDERIWTNLDTINRTASTAKVKAEEGVAKADSALARNIFTDEEKAKLANITNPMVIKGRVDTVNDLPTEAVIGWFYFVGLESASSYEEYCYSENGWEYIGLSQEGVDLSNYYTKKQVDTTVNELKAIDNSLGKRIDNVDSKASKATTKAEEGVAKADNALTQASSNTTNINSLQTDVNSLNTNVKALKATDERIWTNLDTINKTASTAKIKAEEGVAKADDALAATRTNANKIKAHANDIAINRTTLGTQCKNLLKNTAVTKTVNGVTFTVNSDGTITANGTATSRIIFLVGTAYISQTGNYTYTGTPSGGASSTYSMNYRNNNVYKDADTGNGITTQFEGGKTYEAVIDIRSGVTISNLTFSPMLRDADIIDDTYEPYKSSVDERLTENKSNTAINKSTLGYQRKNLFNPNAVNWYQPTKTSIAKDGTITSTVTSDSRTWGYENAEYFLTLSAGKYIVRTVTETINNTASYPEDIRGYNESGTILFDISPNAIGTQTKSFTLTETTTIAIMFKLFTQTCKIMISDADITDSDYEPYKESIDERLIKNKSDIAINKSTLGYQCKNLHDTLSVNWYQPDKISMASNGTVTATITSDTRNFTYANSEHYITLEAGNYIITVNTLEFVSGSAALIRGCNSDNQSLFALSVSSAGLHKTAFSLSKKTTIGIMYKLYSQTCTIMIRDADILDDTYEPYKESVDERLIEDKSNIAINKTTLGYRCKNLLKNTASTTTVNNVTFTVNSDGSITAKQTTTASGNATINVATNITLNPGTYILTGDDEIKKSGYGEIRFYINGTIYAANTAHTFDEEVTISAVRIFVWNGVNINGSKTIYPMLRYADITDDTYEPYKENVDERLIENKSNTAINKSTLGYHCKNLLNETEYLSSIASVSIGTFNISGNSITLTATGKDCYTKPHTSSDGGYRIPVEPDTDYILSWESNNTYAGLVYVFMNGNLSQQKLANNKDTKYIKFTTNSDTTFITIRLGVATSGNSITYSNIMLRDADIIDDTYKPYQPSLQEQTPYSISVSGKSTSAAISYSGVPTLICLTPNTADSTTGGLYMINSAGAVVKLIAETGIVIAANTANNTFTITNNTTTVMDVCISRCWGK